MPIGAHRARSSTPARAARRPLWLALVLGLLLIAAGCGRTDFSGTGGAGGNGSGGGAESSGTNSSASSSTGTGGTMIDGGPDGEDGGEKTLIGLTVTPPVLTLAAGTTAVLTATGLYSDMSVADLTAAATWSSSLAMVAGVTGGKVTAISPGAATITATVMGVSGTAAVTVPSATLKSLAVTPPSAKTNPGGTIAFSAIATLTDASTQDVTAQAAWSSSSAAVASVTSGVATGIAAGTTTISATLAGLTGSAKLDVGGATVVSIALTPTDPVIGAGTTFPFTAIATYSDASIADVTSSAAWASTDATVVDVSATGVAHALAPGGCLVTATLAGVVGSTTVTVTQAPLTKITVTPAAATLIVGGTQAFVATGTYADSTTADLTASVTWTSNSGGVAQISNAAGSQGVATATGGGTATISATLAGVTGTATITVTTATLLSIDVTPHAPTAPKNTPVAFTATGKYSDNSLVNLTGQVAWTTDDGAIASISNAPGSAGVATAQGVGTTGVHAALGGITGSTTITVTSATLVSITVTPAGANLAVGQKQLYKATGIYSDSSQIDLTTTAVWTTADSAVATVSNAAGAKGQLTAAGPGSTTVTATANGISGSATVTVAMPVLSQIVVSPINPTRPGGQKVQFTATAIYTNNTSKNVTQQASWTSSNTAVATMGNPPAQAGVATTIAMGTSTITASYGGLSGTSLLTVSAATVVSITVTPIGPTLAVGTQQNFQAQAIYSDNTSQNVTQQATFVSSNGAVAKTTANGHVTALSPGSATISATYKGVTGTSTVTVTAATVVSISVSPVTATMVPGGYQQFTAQAIYSDNTSKPIGGQATWQSTAPAVIGVSDMNATKGLAHALSPGTALIEASYQGVTGTAMVTVSSATISSIQIAPAQPTVAVGVPVKFTAQAIFSDNTSQDVTVQATWTSTNPMVAGVSDALASKGQTQTLSAGTATITATWNGVSGSTTITVTGATLLSIEVTPFSPTIPVGFVTAMAATGIYSDNTTQDLTKLATWISSAPAVASVSDANATKGTLDPLSAGTATITASYQGVVGSDVVVVSAATLASITVTPATATIGVGQSQPFTAVGTFSDSSTLDVTGYVTWFSSQSSVAAISNAAASKGVAKGLSAGSSAISAVRGAVTGNASITVQ